MGAPFGNQFWKARSTHGVAPTFATPEDLKDACEQYYQWAEDNPLKEYKVAQYQGVPVSMEVPKMRAMTIGGMCIFLGISDDTWRNYCKRDGFIGVCKEAVSIIYHQKLAGASADLFNANIIARDLGLKDASTVEQKVTIEAKKFDGTAEEAAQAYASIMKSADA